MEPLTWIDVGDHLWMLQYIMERSTEGTPYYIELYPKFIVSDGTKGWNRSGRHINYSTLQMHQKIELMLLMRR